MYRRWSFSPAAAIRHRRARAVLPSRPITFPKSRGETFSSRTVVCDFWTSFTSTAPGSSTNPFTRVSSIPFTPVPSEAISLTTVEKSLPLGTLGPLQQLLDRVGGGRPLPDPFLHAGDVELQCRGTCLRIVVS